MSYVNSEYLYITGGEIRIYYLIAVPGMYQTEVTEVYILYTYI